VETECRKEEEMEGEMGRGGDGKAGREGEKEEKGRRGKWEWERMGESGVEGNRMWKLEEWEGER